MVIRDTGMNGQRHTHCLVLLQERSSSNYAFLRIAGLRGH